MITYKSRYSRARARRMEKRKKAGLRDILFLLVSGLIIYSIFANIEVKVSWKHKKETPVKDELVVLAKEPEKTPTTTQVVKYTKEDDRVAKLKTFLESKGSPLAPYAELIVEEADKYDIGWTKVVAISGMESAFGKRLPQGSYNAWGLGGSKFMFFESWEDSIKYVSRLLGTSYKTNELAAIKSKYCPSSDGCNPSWVMVVAQASTDILGIEN